MDKGKRYVIGDIHGCIRTLKALVEDQLQPTGKDTLFFLGDYIDRGPDSKAVLDYLVQLQGSGITAITLMGNHEFMLLESLENDEYFELWKLNGSDATLQSFGIEPEIMDTRQCMRKIPPEYINFLKGLSYYAETEGFFIVHAGLGKRGDKPLEDTDTLFWTRAETYNREILKGRKLVHGHTPMSLESIKDRIYDPEERFINLDGGCVYSRTTGLGNLAGLELDSMTLFVQPNID
jgi:serine/threonine protein phosphatase 1